MQKIRKNFRKIGIITASAAAVGLMAWIAPPNKFRMMMENEFLRDLRKKIQTYNDVRPEDRLYLQFDKPLYEPGDIIWFSAFIRDAATLKPSGKSDIVHVELVNPKGGVEKKISLIAKNGVAAGDFNLEPEALGGVYKVRAYTNWMKNEGEENVFAKELQVQELVLPALKMKLDFERKAFGPGDEVVAKLELNTNENKPLADHSIRFAANLEGKQYLLKTSSTDQDGLTFIKFRLPADLKSNDGLLNVMIDYNGSTESISRSVPIVLNKVALSFYPEGGDLVTGLKSEVAFKALNEFGKAADIKGELIDSRGTVITKFDSYHMGMGSFTFTPMPSEKYSVRITSPENITEKYSLPEALPAGYVLSVSSAPSEMTVDIQSTTEEELSVVAQVRNKVYYTTYINAAKGENKIMFPTGNFPAGVAQVTVFDSKGIARCERLAFVNKNKQLKIDVSTDKDKYLPREKVKMTISVRDERGMPMPANLAMAVVNDQYLSFADDKSGNMLSQMLLEQDLNQKVEEPAFYFDKTKEKSDRALDFLLMTSGWRHFTWAKVLQEPAIPAFAAERAIVAGTVVDAYSGKILPNAKIKINNGAEYNADENGKFIFNKLDLTSPVTLTYSAEGYGAQSQQITSYNSNLSMYLYGQVYTYSTAMEEKADFAAPLHDMVAEPAMAGGPELSVKSVKRARGAASSSVQPAAAPKPAKVDARSEVLAQKPADKEMKEVVVVANNADDRDQAFGFAEKKKDHKGENRNQVDASGGYYRARVFAAPSYDSKLEVEERTDFRNTIYWNPKVEVDRSGKAVVEFVTSDDITSFRATVEGLSPDGMVGRGEKNIFTQLPFAMTAKIPVEVATEDHVSIPLTLKNNTDKPLGGVLTIQAPDGLKSLVAIPAAQTIMPGAAKTIFLDYKVLDKIGYGDFTLKFKSCGLGDALTTSIRISPKGFPVQASFSGQDIEKEYTFDMSNVVNGSVRATFVAYPNVVDDLMKGVEGILQEPYGCFEQTSCTAYPNAMVLDYLKATDSKDNKTLARASDLLARGYKRLTTFETSKNGYEWFGANPAHEGLTAYGLMEFTDMKNAGADVDAQMLDRTAKWILQRKDGKGGFERESHAYHSFGSISKEILDGYIVYALAEAGYTDIAKEFDASVEKAKQTKDPYMLALMANAAYKLKDKRAPELLSSLLAHQAQDGSLNGTTHSITYSQGHSLKIETTALAIMAMLKSPEKNAAALNNAVQYMVGTRSGSGVFSSTQGTILALKALTEFAKFSKKTTEDGKVEIYVDGRKVGEKSYKAGEKGGIEIAGLEKFISSEGKHTVRIKYVGVKAALPYSMAVNWNTSLPSSDKQCDIGLTTKLASSSAKVGETVRLTATITNRKNTDVPSTMAIIGIPAGFTVQPWQLKELQDKKVFDYYELKGNNIAVYYRGMAASDSKVINLDLKAEMPGVFEAPASSAYLYYTNEFKTWTAVDKVTIKKNS